MLDAHLSEVERAFAIVAYLSALDVPASGGSAKDVAHRARALLLFSNDTESALKAFDLADTLDAALLQTDGEVALSPKQILEVTGGLYNRAEIDAALGLLGMVPADFRRARFETTPGAPLIDIPATYFDEVAPALAPRAVA